MHSYVYIVIFHIVSSSPAKNVCPNMEEHEVFVPQDTELLSALGGGEDEFHVSRHIGFFKIARKNRVVTTMSTLRIYQAILYMVVWRIYRL